MPRLARRSRHITPSAEGLNLDAAREAFDAYPALIRAVQEGLGAHDLTHDFTWIIGEIWRVGAETRICDLRLGFPQANRPSTRVAQ
jgi:hypothetical protein